MEFSHCLKVVELVGQLREEINSYLVDGASQKGDGDNESDEIEHEKKNCRQCAADDFRVVFHILDTFVHAPILSHARQVHIVQVHPRRPTELRLGEA